MNSKAVSNVCHHRNLDRLFLHSGGIITVIFLWVTFGRWFEFHSVRPIVTCYNISEGKIAHVEMF